MPVLCLQCGSAFTPPSRRGTPPVCCSEECQRARRREKKRLEEARRMQDPQYRERKRATEGTLEYRERKRARESSPHYKARQHARDAAKWQDPDHRDRRRAYHVDRYRTDPAWRDRRRAGSSARYARTRGAPEAENFTLDEIFERDQGICYLCHDDCSRADATMEHVIPVGPPHYGPHTRANVKLACRSCNSRKGAKLLSELPWYIPTERAS